jgi:hypothetical protein
MLPYWFSLDGGEVTVQRDVRDSGVAERRGETSQSLRRTRASQPMWCHAAVAASCLLQTRAVAHQPGSPTRATSVGFTRYARSSAVHALDLEGAGGRNPAPTHPLGTRPARTRAGSRLSAKKRRPPALAMASAMPLMLRPSR